MYLDEPRVTAPVPDWGGPPHHSRPSQHTTDRTPPTEHHRPIRYTLSIRRRATWLFYHAGMLRRRAIVVKPRQRHTHIRHISGAIVAGNEGAPGATESAPHRVASLLTPLLLRLPIAVPSIGADRPYRRIPSLWYNLRVRCGSFPSTGCRHTAGQNQQTDAAYPVNLTDSGA